jgi:hypothetical protein
MHLEAGGWELSILLPRRLFLFHRELFRMEEGKRKKQGHFCATNPHTIVRIKKTAQTIFRRYPDIGVFHLWPDRGGENAWCACPSCRAFSPGEQNRMSLNAAADALAEVNPRALLSCGETGAGDGLALMDLALRPNIFRVRALPVEKWAGVLVSPGEAPAGE